MDSKLIQRYVKHLVESSSGVTPESFALGIGKKVRKSYYDFISREFLKNRDVEAAAKFFGETKENFLQNCENWVLSTEKYTQTEKIYTHEKMENPEQTRDYKEKYIKELENRVKAQEVHISDLRHDAIIQVLKETIDKQEAKLKEEAAKLKAAEQEIADQKNYINNLLTESKIKAIGTGKPTTFSPKDKKD